MSDFLPGLQEALHAARTGQGGGHPLDRKPDCTVCVAIRFATPGDAREALVIAAAGTISGRALHRSFRSLGLQISREAITTHRNEAHAHDQSPS